MRIIIKSAISPGAIIVVAWFKSYAHPQVASLYLPDCASSYLIVVHISFGGCLGMLLTPLLAIAEQGVFYQGSPALGGVGLTSCPKLEETGGHRKNTPQRCGIEHR